MTDIVETMARALARYKIVQNDHAGGTVRTPYAIDCAVDRLWHECADEARAALSAIEAAGFSVARKATMPKDIAEVIHLALSYYQDHRLTSETEDLFKLANEAALMIDAMVEAGRVKGEGD